MGYQSFVLAIKNLLASKMRSFLTMLGVIIGVAAVFVIAGMGNGMKEYVKQSFSGMGTNTINVNIYGGPENKDNFTLEDMETYIEENKDSFDGFTPDVAAYQVVRYKKNKSDNGVIGATEDYMKLNNLEIEKGRNISYVDIVNKKRVCVVGAFYAKTWFGRDVIGKKIGINGSTFEIVGTIKQVTEKGLPEQYGPDSKILSPYTTVMEIGNIKEINNYTLMAKDGQDPIALKDEISNYIKDKIGNEEFYVMSMADMLKEMNKMINIVSLVLTVIASISLFVGGIGIMNIMLVSVTERTREIGIRKSLGAKNKYILTQFVIEAGVTSGIGGTLGIGVGYLLSFIATIIVRNMSGENIVIVPSAFAVALAFGISVFIGIFFGFLPAWKASKLNPIDALRFT